MERSRLRMAVPLLASLSVHVGLLWAAERIPVEAKAANRRIEVAIVRPEPPPPKVEAPPPEPPPQPPPEAPKPKALPKAKAQPAPPPDPTPPPQQTPPPPPVFAVDMESTVTGGEGPSVRAVEGGGNLFADPKVEGEAGPKETVRAPRPQGTGTQPGATGAGILTPPVFAIPEADRRPPYLEEAKRQEVEGDINIRVCVEKTGAVASVSLLKGLGHGLDEAVLAHVKKRWRFEPAKRDGVPVGHCFATLVSFVLED